MNQTNYYNEIMECRNKIIASKIKISELDRTLATIDKHSKFVSEWIKDNNVNLILNENDIKLTCFEYNNYDPDEDNEYRSIYNKILKEYEDDTINQKICEKLELSDLKELLEKKDLEFKIHNVKEEMFKSGKSDIDSDILQELENENKKRMLTNKIKKYTKDLEGNQHNIVFTNEKIKELKLLKSNNDFGPRMNELLINMRVYKDNVWLYEKRIEKLNNQIIDL